MTTIPFHLQGGEVGVKGDNNSLTFELEGSGISLSTEDFIVISNITFYVSNVWNVIDEYGYGVHVIQNKKKN